MASGTTSSIMAWVDHTGTCQTGAASHCAMPEPGLKRPLTAMTTIPTSRAAMIGGSRMRGHTEASRKASTMGPATSRSSRTECTRSVPNRRNTAATMPITIGIGTADMARRTHPQSPSTSMSSPVAK